MTRPGVHYHDLQPAPDDEETEALATTKPREPTSTLGFLSETTTISHEMAKANHGEKAITQAAQREEVVDLGWREDERNRPKPILKGIPNEELWALIRRFNKQMYHVKEYPYPVPGNLDLNSAAEEEFSPDKLRSNMERLYMTVIVGLFNFGKHIVRLRSWRETKRTAWACTVYFIAWSFDLLMPLFLATLLALIAYPPSRSFLFPPAPVDLLLESTGRLQKPEAGLSAGHDTPLEAVEREASDFVRNLASLVISNATGKPPQGDPPSDKGAAHDIAHDLMSVAAGASHIKHRDARKTPTTSNDETKGPIEMTMWIKLSPVMRGIATVADFWERFANALSPTYPFPKDTYRLRLAAVLIPAIAGSIFLTPYMLFKGLTFALGFSFFGDPIISRAIDLLNRRFPDWVKYIDLRNNILFGVPTNAQLTITLLRVGEANGAPLPPPHSNESLPDKGAEASGGHLRATSANPPLSATTEDFNKAMEHDPYAAHHAGGSHNDAAKDSEHGKKTNKVLGFFKATAKATVETAITADTLKAKLGSEQSKQRLGAIPQSNEEYISGPVDFRARFHGKKGHVYISSNGSLPTVSFTEESSVGKFRSHAVEEHKLDRVWTVPVADIKELKKIGGYGWKTQLAVGLVLDKDIAEGLEVVDKLGNTFALTAVPLREELFNRLIAMGAQKWEAL